MNQTRVAKPTVPFYRYLYDTVGADYVWWLRRTMLLACAGVALFSITKNTPTLEESLRRASESGEGGTTSSEVRAAIYAAPVLFTNLAVFFKVLGSYPSAVM